MSVAWTVQGDSEDETRDALERLCKLLGLVPALPPSRMVHGRWIARAQAVPSVADSGTPA